ncbi:MAG: hypothetical protein KDA52_12350, partial [Planctomycetaceae bacterium]|nr:hypothetical protein [Planctomycetaceae bacterium]
TTGSTYELFIQAMNITNASMEANCESATLKPLLNACELNLADEDLIVTIYEGRPDNALESFTIRLNGVTFVLVSRGVLPNGGTDWYVSEDYLRDVTSHPREYIDDPALLSLDWLRQRSRQTA